MSKSGLLHLLKQNAPSGGLRAKAAEGSPLLCTFQHPENRVLKAPGGYVCGLCGKQKATLESAYMCLQNCTVERRLRSPISSEPAPLGMVYHCSYCSKTYKNARDAEDCAKKCLHSRGLPEPLQNEIAENYSALLRKQSLQVRKPLERRTTPRPPPPVFESFQPTTETRSNSDISEEFPDFEPTLPAAAPPEVPQAPSVSAPEPEEAREETVVNTEGLLYRTRGQKAFKRMDAKYACSVCGILFFTKSEVETCFEAHPLLDPDV